MAGTGREVRVARGEDGTIRVGPFGTYDQLGAVGTDFTWSVLDVAGAVLAWPVLGEPGPPVAQIHDEGRAQQWLWALYGEPVAAAAHTAGADVTVRTEPSALAGAAARLGLAHWASRWWPASHPDGIPVLRPDVLGLESAALTHRCQQLFDDAGDQPDDCVAELIEEHRAALAPLLQWWHTAPRPAALARHVDGVLRTLDDAADCAGLDGTELRGLRAALDEGPDHGRRDVAALFAQRAGYALAAGEPLGSGGRLIARGTGTNDWRRHPPGFVDAGEHAVSWTLRAVGARRRIEIEVVAHVAAPATGAPLVAEVRVNGGRASRVALARRDDVWVGRGDVDLAPDRPDTVVPSATAAPPRVEVGVLLPGFDPGAGPDARAGRDAVRALARRRLAAAARPVADGAHDDVRGPFLAETLAAATNEDY